jgi:hypothetical protein
MKTIWFLYAGLLSNILDEYMYCVVKFSVLNSSVADPCHFGTDPDPRIRTSDSKTRLRILLFSSVYQGFSDDKRIPSWIRITY